MKIKERESAIKLRKRGRSVKEIAKTLKVAQSSVSLWVRNVKLKPAHKKRLKKKQLDNAKKCLIRKQKGDISTRRREMGEDAWREYKKIQGNNKNLRGRLKNPEKYVNREVNVKQRLVDYKGGKCKECGYDKCLGALEFHHRDPKKKDFGISSNHRSFENLRIEADKCDLLCNRCHMEIHWELHKKRREARIKALKQKALELL